MWLGTEKWLPFCWNSVPASASDGTLHTLTEGEIATVNAIYEGIKPLYKFPFAGTSVNADDAVLAPPAGYDPFNTATADNVPLPTADVTSYSEGDANGEDLPF